MKSPQVLGPAPSGPLTLKSVRRLLEGVIPPTLCTVSAEGVPHVTMLSHAEYVDAEHLALTFQFFNRSRENVMATRRAAVMVEDPQAGVSVVMQLQYERTETEGPLFERMRAKLASVAAHTGMEKVFRLRGADVYRVLEVQRVEPRRPLPGVRSRCDLIGGTLALAQKLADCADLDALLEALVAGLRDELCIDHAILWWLDERRGTLLTLASTGYDETGVGAELPLSDAGLVGVALREQVPIRIGHMTSMYRYGMAWRERTEQLGLEAVLEREIALPGLATPRSQLAVPLRARGRSVGALLVESDRDQFFSYDDEDALVLVGTQLAQALLALQAADAGEPAGEPSQFDLPAWPESAPAGPVVPAAPRGPMRVRYHPRDGSLFIDDRYLIKGVAGAVLWKLLQLQRTEGRQHFTTRELRLAGEELRLPEVQDNLSVRLLLLQRRLAEREPDLVLTRTGRGQLHLQARRALVLIEAA